MLKMPCDEKPKRTYPIVTTEIPLLLFGLALHTYFPSFKNLLLTKVCLNHFDNNQTFCSNTSNPAIGKNDYVQTNVSRWDLYGSLFYYIPACFTAIYIGSWGDRFGRKFPLLIPPVGFFLYLLFLALFDLYIIEMPIWTTAVTNFINGIAGGELIMISLAISYVIAISDYEYRIRRISIIQAMVTFAGTLGPLIGLALKNKFGSFAVFLGAAALCLLSFLYSLLFLKKVDPEQPQVLNFKNLFNMVHIKEGLNVCFRPRENSHRKYLLIMLSVSITYFFTSNGARTLVYLFVKDAPLSWNFTSYTLLSSITAAVGGVFMLIIFPIFRKYVHVEDTVVAIVSAAADVLYYSILGFSTTTVLVYVASSFLILSWFQPISCRTIISKLVNSDEEGKIFSIIALAENIGFMLSTIIFNGLWPSSRKVFNGILFEACAVVTLIYICALAYIHVKLRRQARNNGYRRLSNTE